jgi:hypothetical protein
MGRHENPPLSLRDCRIGVSGRGRPDPDGRR